MHEEGGHTHGPCHAFQSAGGAQPSLPCLPCLLPISVPDLTPAYTRTDSSPDQECGAWTPTISQPLREAMARYGLIGVPELVSELMDIEDAVAAKIM